jgi:SWIM/SEC-C metal-binding protein
MGKRVFVGDRRERACDGEKSPKFFDGEKPTKLGTEKKPAVVNVQTEERFKEVRSICKEKGWKYIIGMEPDKPEDMTDLEALLNARKPRIAENKVGRNEPCPGGSGKKSKKCSGPWRAIDLPKGGSTCSDRQVAMSPISVLPALLACLCR